MEYKTIFRNGVTIINTGDPVGGVKNKTGHKGISLRKNGKYRAVLQFGKDDRLYLGEFPTIEEAVAMYAAAEKHWKDGTLLEWAESLYGVTKHRRKPSKGKEKCK